MDPKKNVVSWEDFVEGILTLSTEEAKKTFVSVFRGLENLARMNKIKTKSVKEFRRSKADAIDGMTIIRPRKVAIKHDITSYWFFLYPARYENKSGWRHSENWTFTLEELKKEIEENGKGVVITNYVSGDPNQSGLVISVGPDIKTKSEAEEYLPYIIEAVARLQK